jgi:hypothetical protein
MGELKVYLFDPPRVEMDKAPVDIQRRKALALLVYLATSGQAPQQRRGHTGGRRDVFAHNFEHLGR